MRAVPGGTGSDAMTDVERSEGAGGPPSVWPTTYTVSCLPLWHVDCDAYSITVEHRGGTYTDRS
jgi:hypothetical protein